LAPAGGRSRDGLGAHNVTPPLSPERADGPLQAPAFDDDEPTELEKAAAATLGSWAQIKDADLKDHADAILGIYKNEVVTAFDIVPGDDKKPWRRGDDNRVTFNGQRSRKWDHLIGTPNPGKPWVQGQGRPVQVLPTVVLIEGNVPVENTSAGRRAVVDGYVLTVEDGSARLQAPEKGKVTVSLLPC